MGDLELEVEVREGRGLRGEDVGTSARDWESDDVRAGAEAEAVPWAGTEAEDSEEVEVFERVTLATVEKVAIATVLAGLAVADDAVLSLEVVTVGDLPGKICSRRAAKGQLGVS